MAGFHRDAQPVPTDQAERAALLKWLLAHPLWTHPYLMKVPPAGSADSLLGPTQPDWVDADIGDGDFHDRVDIMPVLVNPETLCIDDDEAKNTAFQVWIEAGGWHDLSTDANWPEPEGGWTQDNKWIGCHDTSLDCGAAELEPALLELAVRVKFHYGEGRDRLEGVGHDRCEGSITDQGTATEQWHPSCVIASDGWCQVCGLKPPRE